MRTPFTVAATLAAVAASSLLVACGGGGNPTGAAPKGGTKVCSAGAPSKAVTVNLLAFSAPSIDPFSDAMAKGCSGISNLTVKHTPVDFTAQLQKANLALGTGGRSPYDIVEVYNATLIEYAAKGWLEPLDAYIAKYKDKYKLGDIPQRLWDAFTYKGKVYGIPNQQNVQILMYRKDVFKRLGLTPPTTYDELEATAAKLDADKKVKYPLAMAWGADDGIGNGFNNALVGYGGRLLDDNGKATFDSPAGLKALQAMKALLPHMSKETLTANNGDVMSLVQQGSAAMTVLWAGRAGPIEDSNQSRVVGKVGYAPAPVGAAGSPPATEWSQDGYAMAKRSGVDKDLLFQVMAASVAPSVMRDAAPVALVSRDSVTGDRAVAGKQPQWPAALKTIAAGAKTLPPLPQVAQAQQVLNPILARILGGKLDARTGLRQAAAEVDKKLAAG